MAATADTKTIDPQHAERLRYATDGEMAGDWCREADVHVETSRWMERRFLVLRHDDGTTWALDYARGLTEDQEHEYPWRDATGPLPLTRVYRNAFLKVRYDVVPPPDPQAPEVVVDAVYDELYAALGEHDLILCPTTGQGPDYGVESGHVHDIAVRLVRAMRGYVAPVGAVTA